MKQNITVTVSAAIEVEVGVWEKFLNPHVFFQAVCLLCAEVRDWLQQHDVPGEQEVWYHTQLSYGFVHRWINVWYIPLFKRIFEPFLLS